MIQRTCTPRRRWLAVHVLVGFTAATMAWSSAGASDQESQFFAEMPVVLSGSRLPQSLFDTPGAVTVLDRDMIRATGYRYLHDLLRLVPGFNVANERGWAGIVNYHGLSGGFSNRLLVLIDGRPINSEYWNGGIDWVSQPVDVDDIERIEVLRGSNSTSYGTNAYLGVVNISTRRPLPGDGWQVRVGAGSGIADRVLRATLGGESVAAALTVSRLGDSGQPRLRDDLSAERINLRLDTQPGQRDQLMVAAGWQRSNAGEGFNTDVYNPERDRRTVVGFALLRWHRQLGGDDELSLQVNYSRDRYVDEMAVPNPLTGEPLPYDLNRMSTRKSIEVKYLARWSPSLRSSWGVELRHDAMFSRIFLGGSAPVASRMARSFANLEWQASSRLLINGGAMVEHVSHAGTRLSPRLFANFAVQPEHILRAGWSTATRAPTLVESFANATTTSEGFPLDQSRLGNRELRPERMRTVEAGYFGRFAGGAIDADLRLYKERLSGLIAEVPAREIYPDLLGKGYSYANLESARVAGVEYQLRLRPWTGGVALINENHERVRQRIARVQGSAPRRSTTLAWFQRLAGGVSFSLMHYRVDAMEWLEFGDRMPAYTRTDGRLARDFVWAGGRAELALVGTNLFDRYRDFRDQPEHLQQRRLWTTLRLSF